MQLIENWKRHFPRFWSVRLALLAAVLSGLEVGVNTYVTGQPPVIALGSMVVSIGAALARVIAQPELHGEAE